MSEQTVPGGARRASSCPTMYQYLSERDSEATVAIANQVRMICASVCLMFMLGAVALWLRPLCGSRWAPVEITGLAAGHYGRATARHPPRPVIRSTAADDFSNKPTSNPSGLQSSPSPRPDIAATGTTTAPAPSSRSSLGPSCVHAATFYPATAGFTVAVLAVLLLLSSAVCGLRLQCRRATVVQRLLRAARAGCAEIPRDKLARLVDAADLTEAERVVQRSRRQGYGAV